jgi:hypothetical protein
MLAVAPPDGTTVLILIQPPANSPQARLIGRATQVVFVTENLAATYREWHSRGVVFRGAPRLRRVSYEPARSASASGTSVTEDHATAWGGAFARFEDVDRNSFALVSFDEVSRAVEAQRQAAAERRDAERRAAHELEIARQFQRGSFRSDSPNWNHWSTPAPAFRRITSIVTSVFEEVRRFTGGQQRDDVTLIVARCRSRGATKPTNAS